MYGWQRSCRANSTGSVTFKQHGPDKSHAFSTSNNRIELLTSFTGLVECILNPGCGILQQTCNLQPLQHLPQLVTLVLIHGQLSALDAAKYLTSLHTIGASATSEYSGACVDMLVKLKLDDASLYNFCTSACSRLQDLEVYDSLNGCQHGTVVDLCTGHGQP